MDIEAIMDEIALECGGTVRAKYKGRGQFSIPGMAIDTDRPECASEAARDHGLLRPHIDRMGKSFIVYWPDSYGPQYIEAQLTAIGPEISAIGPPSLSNLPQFIDEAPNVTRETLDRMPTPRLSDPR